MNDQRKTKTQLIEEIKQLRLKINNCCNAEDSLKNIQNNKIYKTIYENAPIFVSCLNSHKQCILWNKQCRKVFGWTMEELNSHDNMLSLMHPKHKDRDEILNSIYHKPDNVFREWHPITKDGKLLSVMWATIKLPEGNLVAMGYDITEQKKAKEDLRLAKDFAENLVETAGAIVISLDINSNIKTFNTYAEDLTGWKKTDVLEKNWIEIFITPKDKKVIPKVFSQAILDMPEVSKYENNILTKNGEMRLISWSNSTIRDKNGKVDGLLCIGTDLTDRKKAEEERNMLQQQMQHAQKLESLGILAGGIAHDFNNLLMAITGNTDLAMQEISQMSPIKINLIEIETATKRAANLAQQMLAYSGKGQFVIQTIDAANLIKEIAPLLKASTSKKAVLNFKFKPNVPTFNGDIAQIRQIIINLITNAAESIGDNRGVISLSTGVMNLDSSSLDEFNKTMPMGLPKLREEGVYTYFKVSDTGCGMTEQTIENIFDPFFTTKFTGRGLGMSVVLGIVKGHKGTIKMHSKVNKGTYFKIILPAKTNNTQTVSSHSSSSEKSQKNNLDKAPMPMTGTILIVDDEQIVRNINERMLIRLGFIVLKASNGCEAMKIFEIHKKIIICTILDLTMPFMDGEETFKAIKLLQPDAKIIICSGYSEKDAAHRFVGKGLSGFLQKPFHLNLLKSKLLEILPINKKNN